MAHMPDHTQSPLEFLRSFVTRRAVNPSVPTAEQAAARSGEKEVLIAAVKTAKAAHDAAVAALEGFETAPANHVYDSLEDAEGALYEFLRDMAGAACEGSHNRGEYEYRQHFFIGGVEHVAIADVDYGRHDKTYWFVDSFKLRIEAAP